MARPPSAKLERSVQAADQRSKLKAAIAFLWMVEQSLGVAASPAPQDPVAVVRAQDSDFLQGIGRVGLSGS